MMNPQQAALRTQLVDALEWEPSLGSSRLDVSVGHDGVVKLGGVVSSYAQKVAAERAVKRVKGVHAVVNDVDVRIAITHERTDTQLGEAVVQALEWDVLVPHEKIQARVSDGWVRLEGDVDWNYQRAAAEAAVHRLTGIKGMTNLITVKPHVSDEDRNTQAKVKDRIRAALERSADLEAAAIEVEAHDGTVVLRGCVNSWTELEAAEAAAWAAPGIAAVDDQLRVESRPRQ
jgi:osmotically-inducible protein OsmY